MKALKIYHFIFAIAFMMEPVAGQNFPRTPVDPAEPVGVTMDAVQKNVEPESSDISFGFSSAPESYTKATETYSSSEFEQAIAMFREVLLESKDPSEDGVRLRLSSHLYIAKSLAQLKRYADAELEVRTGLLEAESRKKIDMPAVDSARTLLVKLLFRQGKWIEAEMECRNSLKLSGRLQSGMWDDSQMLRLLVHALKSRSKFAEAVVELRVLRGRPGYNAWEIGDRLNLAECLTRSGRPDLALTEARDTLYSLKYNRLNEADIAPARMVIADALTALGKPGDAEGQLRMALEARNASIGVKHRNTIRTAFKLGVCLWAQRKYETALTALDDAARAAREYLGEEHPDTREYERFLTALRVR